MQGASDRGPKATALERYRPISPDDPPVRQRFRQQLRTGTRPEIDLRRELHRRGRRFRVEYTVPGMARRRIDVAFPKRHLAVFIDGCFWHGCPEHFVPPKTNNEWWMEKIERNQRRDRSTDAHLRGLGWVSLRLWEHLSPVSMADTVDNELRLLK